VPLLGRAEKGQLEELIIQTLRAEYDAQGPAALLAENVRVVVIARGPAIDHGETVDPLAEVSLRTLFTALCYLTGGTAAMPREALDALATEATSACAAQINRLAAD
jgi:hypothetical protein